MGAAGTECKHQQVSCHRYATRRYPQIVKELIHNEDLGYRSLRIVATSCGRRSCRECWQGPGGCTR